MRITRIAAWIGAVALVCSATASAQEAAKAPHMYVGAKKCKTCHNSEKGGAQFKKWAETKHAGAFATLATQKALEIAKGKGIADPQKSDDCLQCHVTGHGKPADHFKPTFVAADGVGCESCHGPGSDYLKMKTMQAIKDGTMKGEDLGLTRVTKETCMGCHNEKSPTFKKDWDFKADSTKISHPIPPGYKRGAGAAEGGEEGAK